MKIALVTACLAPGKDGVGDYARDLASECEAGGHSCVLVALNDRFIDRPSEERQATRGRHVEALRLPASAPWPQRLLAAEEWLKRAAPDWISLQLVTYGFHPKGLIGDLAVRLAPLSRGRSVHLMLHELWIGMERGAPWRRRLVGHMQRRAVLALVSKLDPALVHTTNGTYAALLDRWGVANRVLALCGSIPILSSVDAQWLTQTLLGLGVPPPRSARDGCWRFGMFGALHPSWSPEPLFTQLGAAARSANRQIVIASIGRRGPGEELWQHIQRRYGDRFSFAALGERPLRDISSFLQSVDFGIAITPWQLIGKSGTTAAMLDHGLPVIVSRDDQDFGVTPSTPISEPLLYRMDAGLPEWLHSVKRQPACSRLPHVARQFITDLELTSASHTNTTVLGSPLARGNTACRARAERMSRDMPLKSDRCDGM
jgi:hypothetical protein